MKRVLGSGLWAPTREEAWQSFMRRRPVVAVSIDRGWLASGRLRRIRTALAGVQRPVPSSPGEVLV